MVRTKKNDIFKNFSNISELNHYLTTNETTEVFQNNENSKTGSSSWTGTESYDAANDFLLYGCNELRAKIEDAGVKKIRTEIKKYMTRRTIHSSVVGAAPNVPAFISGAPNCMMMYQQKRVKQRVGNVAYNMAISGSEGQDRINDTAAKLIAALMLTEAKGIRVNLYMFILAEKKGNLLGCSLKIKSSGQKFDVLKMAYPLAHSSMLRRHYLRYVEVTENVSPVYLNNYGSPVTNNAENKKYLAEHGLKCDVVTSFYDLRYKSVDDIVKVIIGN